MENSGMVTLAEILYRVDEAKKDDKVFIDTDPLDDSLQDQLRDMGFIVELNPARSGNRIYW